MAFMKKIASGAGAIISHPLKVSEGLTGQKIMKGKFVEVDASKNIHGKVTDMEVSDDDDDKKKKKKRGKKDPDGDIPEENAKDKEIKEAVKDAGEEQELLKMIPGDYMVHVFIEWAKNIKCNEGATVDPLVCAEVFGMKKYTKVQKHIDEGSLLEYNEHIFFEPKNVQEVDLLKSKIQIKLMDKGFINSDLLGFYEFDLHHVYSQNNEHAILHKWISLSDPASEDYFAVTANLKLSICVTGPKDRAIAIEKQVDLNEHDTLAAPTTRNEFYQFAFKFYDCEHIIPMDKRLVKQSLISGKEREKSDVFIRLEHRSQKKDSAIRKCFVGAMDRECQINQEFLVPIQMPLISNNILFKVLDDDVVGNDDIGIISLNLRDWLEGSRQQDDTFWVNLYGAPEQKFGQKTNKYADHMNNNPDLGSYWRGRILMSVTFEKVQAPKFIVRNVEPCNYPDRKLYQFQVYMGSALALPKSSKNEYHLEIAFGEHKIGSGIYQVTNSHFFRWNKMVPSQDDQPKERPAMGVDNQKQGLIWMPYREMKNCPDIFVYLCKSGKRLSYQRIPSSRFSDLKTCKLEWHEMIADRAVGKIKMDHRAGIVSTMITFIELPKNRKPANFAKEKDIFTGTDLIANPWKGFFNWYELGGKKGRLNVEKIRVHIFQCRNLPSADEDGNADPFVVVHDDGSQSHIAIPENQGRPYNQTRVIPDNLNPPFYQTLEITLETIHIKKMDGSDTTDRRFIPPFVLDVYDSDLACSQHGKEVKSDFLGRAVIQWHKFMMCSYDDTICIPEWHPLRASPNVPSEGQILCSFTLAKTNDYKFIKPANETGLYAMVDHVVQDVNINVLGMRNLKTTGLVPVRKAFIQFNVKSLVPPDYGTPMPNIRTEPQDPGPNPTLNAVISFSTPIPQNKLYSPHLSCQVFDQLYKGLRQPTLGTFIVPVGDLRWEQTEKRKKQQLSMQKAIQDLEDIRDKRAVGPAYQDDERTLTKFDLNGIREFSYSSIEKNHFKQDRQYLMDSVNDPHEYGKLEAQQQNITEAALQRRQQTRGMSSHQKYALTLGQQIVSEHNAKLDHQEQQKSNKNGYIGFDSGSYKNQYTNFYATSNEYAKLEQIASESSLARRETHNDLLMPTVKRQSKIKGIDVKRQVTEGLKEHNQKEFRQVEDYRQQDYITYAQLNPHNAHKTMLLPTYKWDPQLKVNIEEKQVKPPSTIYMTLGFDRDEILLKNNQNQLKADEENLMKQLKKRTSINLISHQKITANQTSQVSSKKFDQTSLLKLDEGQKREQSDSASSDDEIIQDKQTDKKRPKKEEKKKEARNTVLLDVEVGKKEQKLRAALLSDNVDTIRRKHYRYYFNEELETVQSIFEKKSPFDSYEIIAGQERGAKKKMFQFLRAQKFNEQGLRSTTKKVGTVKALIQIENDDQKIFFANQTLEKEAKMKEVLQQIAQQKGYDLKGHLTGYENKLDNAEGRKELEEKIMGPLGVKHLGLTKMLSYHFQDDILKRKLLVPQQCIIRVYMIDARNLASRDIGSPSDPYLTLKVNNKKYTERENYQLDEENPDFFKSYDFESEFPGCAPLEIDLMDYDDLFGDDLIGSTQVDLEDRYFNHEWAALQDKPIETRQLYHPSMGASQGLVRMWVEIAKAQEVVSNSMPVWDIAPKEPEEFEVRVVIWDATDVKMMDNEDTTDAFVRCFFDSRKALETDTHYRLQPGDMASWNYRLCFRIKHKPDRDDRHILTVQCYDRDWFKKNDLVGSKQIDLSNFFEDCSITNRPMQMNEKYVKREKESDTSRFMTKAEKQFKWDEHDKSTFNLDLYGKNKNNMFTINAKMRMQIDILPIKSAEQTPVGQARDDPNHSPFLPPPVGRISLTFNPFKLYNQCFGPAMRKKINKFILTIFCIICGIACCIYIVPGVISNWFTDIL